MNVPVNVKDGKAENNRQLSTALEYEITMTDVDDCEGMRYTTYGILAKDSDKNILVAYEDISTSREYVQGFIDRIKDHDISAMHIGDLLEDYLD